MANTKPSKPEPKATIDCWAENEFGHAPLTDKRLGTRLKKIATAFARMPTASIPQASGDWGTTKAAYRFFDNKAVSSEIIMENHLLATVERIRPHKLILAIQDTTSLNYSTHPQTQGLGPISNNSQKTLGLFGHTCLASTTDGVPLGIIDSTLFARDPAKYGSSKERNAKPIEEKESNRWLKSFQVVQQLASLVRETQIVSIADREADIYELFAMAAEHDNAAGLLVRAQHNRTVEREEKRLFTHLHSQPVAATLEVHIPPGTGRKARTARLTIRFAQVKLKPPVLKEKELPITLWAVEALEEQPPSGIKALCWKLLTNVAVFTAKDAIERVEWYSKRWLIEVFHKVLKSGCEIEERQLETAERLGNCAALDRVVAWRILFLTVQGRYTPNAPASAYFAEHEWKSLYCFINKTNVPPKEAPTLHQTIRWIAQLGGFLGRKGDGNPGPTTLWRGLARLQDIAEAYLVFNPTTCG